MMQSAVSHQIQAVVQPSLAQLSDQTMQFHTSSKNLNYRRRYAGKYSEQEKLPKPEMERKRRERINASLETLRHLVAEPILKQRAEKLEKADILELTVQYLQAAASHNANVAGSYFLAGYTSCEENLIQYINSSGVKMAPLITAVERQKHPALHNFLNTFNQQTESTPQAQATNTEIAYALGAEGGRHGKDVLWRPW